MTARRAALSFSIVVACVSRGVDAQVTTPEEAARLKGKAEQGDADAQNGLGFLYQRGGAGLVQDQQQAIYWYLLAARQGLGAAQNNLCTLHASALNVYQGVRPTPGQPLAPIEPATGTKIDVEGILTWCPKAADQGFAASQRALGLLYAKGARDSTGATLSARNNEEAYFWLLQGPKNVFRDAVGDNLTSERREHVERRAAAWRPARPVQP
jgi:TPR repeat protein